MANYLDERVRERVEQIKKEARLTEQEQLRQYDIYLNKRAAMFRKFILQVIEKELSK